MNERDDITTTDSLTRRAGQALDGLQELIEAGSVLLDEREVLELLGCEGAEVVAGDALEGLHVQRRQTKVLAGPLDPTLYFFFSPLGGI